MKAPVLPIPKDEEVSEEAVEDSGNESSRPAKESEHVQQHAAEHHKESGLSNVSEALASEEVDHEDHPIGNGALDSSEVHTPLVNEDEVNNNNKNNVNVPEDTQKDGEKHIEEGDRKADIETGETKKNGGA